MTARCDPNTAGELWDRVSRLFKGEPGIDAKIYTVTVVGMLCEFPENVVRRVCAPTTGLPSRHTFWPAPAEVFAFCEEIYAPLRPYEERQLERERSMGLALPPPEPPTPEERDRMVEHWERLRPAFTGDRSAGQVQAEAEKHLGTLMERRNEPVTLGSALVAIIDRAVAAGHLPPAKGKRDDAAASPRPGPQPNESSSARPTVPDTGPKRQG